jgi:hypothetical protein
MTNEKRIILLIGALIVAGLWFRVIAEYTNPTNPTNQVINTAQAALIDPEDMSPQETQAVLIETIEFGKVCTSAGGSPVKCSEVDEDSICIRTLVAAQRGFRVDCKSDRPVPANDDSWAREGGTKYKSPY